MGNQVGAADTALAATQTVVPATHHLPVAKVRLVAFDDPKSERPNMMPFRMFFGTIKDGKEKDSEVWILLQNDHAAGRSPHQRFNIFDRLGKLRGAMSADDAVRQTGAASAFRFLKRAGVIDMDQLRAVIKYYFIFMKVVTPVPWIVGDHFITSLTAACKVAGESAVMAAAASSSVKVAKARRTPQITSQRAPIVSMIPAVQAGPSLFIPEGPLKRARTMTPDLPRKRVTTSTPPLRSNPPAATVQPSSSAMVDKGQGFLIHSDSVEADNSDAMDTSRASSTRRESTDVLIEKSPNSQSSIDFPNDYRKAIDRKTRCKENLMLNKENQKDLRGKIEALETKMADLKVEGRKLKEENRHLGIEMKHLRSSLTQKERDIFVLGGEMVKRASERAKKGMKSESDSGEED
ncbi:hypothetical protein BKA58DRAFT_460016 [Alternaria rosae]|uniref:uncharacterized protein n=1 Tax=Alternaria rosae TaxID=1187941 RepID=UPI001E8D74FB|nr:uncharacterized protein BKA58DRAFT_460016 [Alternaria rosae]KAH6866353.1 hypothetical protein BKA58DRAFT_460016 [Alternaria rosae]